MNFKGDMGPLISFAVIIFLLGPGILSVTLADSGSAETNPTRGEKGGYFSSRMIYETNRKLSGSMAVGDPDLDGTNEVLLGDWDGNVVILEPLVNGDFSSGIIWQEPGPPGANKSLLDLHLVDILPEHEGPEIIVGGYSKNITAIYHSDGEWVTEVLFRSPYRVFNMAIGDITGDGKDEILFSSSELNIDLAIWYLRRETGGGWVSETIDMPDAVRALTVADVDPRVPGMEIWAATERNRSDAGLESNLLEVYRDGDSWMIEDRYYDPENIIANVQAGDIWSTKEGDELLLASFSGWCTVVWYEEGVFHNERIFQARSDLDEPSAIEGLAIGDYNPMHPGDEGIVSGYYNKVTQILDYENAVDHELVWSAPVEDINLEIAGVAVGDVSENPGNEALIANFQGWVMLLEYEYDGLSMEVAAETIDLALREENQIDITLIPRGFLKGEVEVSIQAPEGLEVTLPSDIELTGHDPMRFPIWISRWRRIWWGRW